MYTRRLCLATSGLGLGVAAVLFTAGPAAAHVTPDKTEVPARAFTAVTLTVPHGCEASPTRQLIVQVPEGINDVTPAVLPGWDVTVTTEPLPEPIEDAHGNQLTERESEVTFTAQAGNELPDGFRQGYTLGFQAPETPGEYLFFKTIQVCNEGQTEWIEEYTGEGEEPEHPSPVIEVTAAEEGGHGDATEEATGDEEATSVETETAAAVDESDDDDSSQGIAIAGLVAGILGLLAGGAALITARKTAKS